MTGLLVLGMHRSGTSALTRLLNLLGAAINEDVLPANASNERGFWEPREVVDIHNAIFEKLDSSWDSVWSLPQDWHTRPELDQERRRLEECLQHYGRHDLWVMKDPRVCRLLPLWSDLLDSNGMTAGCISIIRHPGEVAASLEKRKKLGTEQAILLWLRYVLDAELYSRERHRAITTYDQLMTDWRSSTVQMAESLQITWPNSIDSVADEIDAFLSADLRHYTDSDRDRLASLSEPVRGMVTRTWETLRALADDPTNDVTSVFDETRCRFNELSDCFHAVERSMNAARERSAKSQSVGDSRELQRMEKTHREQLARLEAARKTEFEHQAVAQRTEVARLTAAHEAELTQLTTRLSGGESPGSIRRMKRELNSIKASRAWRLVTWYRKNLLPQNSLRRRCLAGLFRGFRFLIPSTTRRGA